MILNLDIDVMLWWKVLGVIVVIMGLTYYLINQKLENDMI